MVLVEDLVNHFCEFETKVYSELRSLNCEIYGNNVRKILARGKDFLWWCQSGADNFTGLIKPRDFRKYINWYINANHLLFKNPWQESVLVDLEKPDSDTEWA